MKISILVIAIISIFFSAKAQTIHIQAGTTVSYLDWRLAPHPFRIFNEKSLGYSFFVGLDYLERKYLNISSNVGLIRKGGRMQLHVVNDAGEFTGLTMSRATLDYFSINTMLELKHPISDKFIPFFSFGPKMDILFNSSRQFAHIKEQEFFNKTIFGCIAGVGLKYKLNKSIIGIRLDHYTDFNNVANFTVPEVETVFDLNANMFSLNVTYGYKF